jgi:hypothetical protein
MSDLFAMRLPAGSRGIRVGAQIRSGAVAAVPRMCRVIDRALDRLTSLSQAAFHPLGNLPIMRGLSQGMNAQFPAVQAPADTPTRQPNEGQDGFLKLQIRQFSFPSSLKMKPPRGLRADGNHLKCRLIRAAPRMLRSMVHDYATGRLLRRLPFGCT